jgi:hypothetical protein
MMDAYIAGLATKRRSAITKRRLAIAALLRAAADQVVPDDAHKGLLDNDYILCKRKTRRDILAIADELEGGAS